MTSMLISSSRQMSHHELYQTFSRHVSRNSTTNTSKTQSKQRLAALIAALAALLVGLYSYYQLSTPPKIGNTASATARRSMSMAWRSSGASNEALIENLAKNGLIHSPRVKQAMLGVRQTHNNTTFKFFELTNFCTRSTAHTTPPTPPTKTPPNPSATAQPSAHRTCTPQPANLSSRSSNLAPESLTWAQGQATSRTCSRN